MKKSIILFVFVSIFINAFAQPPERLSYQAVIRNSSDNLITNEMVGMRISILQSSAAGTAVYVETHKPITNENGLATIEIGGGTPVTGTFSGIKWAADNYYLKTETDPAGGSSYTITGTSQLLSVPYSLYSKTAGNGSLWTQLGSDIYFTGGKVGIGGANLGNGWLQVKAGSYSEIARFETTATSNWISLYTSGVRKGIVWINGNTLTLRSDEGAVNFKTNGNNERLTIEDDGDISTPATGANKHLLPVAYGYVSQVGELISARSTSNVSSSVRGSPGSYEYTVTISGITNYIVLVTPGGNLDSFPRVTYYTGYFTVNFMSHTGAAGQANNFSFVVFAP